MWFNILYIPMIADIAQAHLFIFVRSVVTVKITDAFCIFMFWKNLMWVVTDLMCG